MKTLTLSLLLLVTGSARAQEDACAIPADEQAWTQRALSAWERDTRDFFRTSPSPLPWIVLIGPRCSWHLAPPPDAGSLLKEAVALSGGTEIQPGWVLANSPVAVIAVPRDGRARLPDGSILDDEVLPWVDLTRKGEGAFVAFPTLETARRAYPKIPVAELERLVLWTFNAVVAQARLLAEAGPELRRIANRYGEILDFDPDALERELREKRRYVSAYEAERDLLFRAAAEPDEGRARELAAEALQLAELRRARWLDGRRTWLREVEPVVLWLEGLSQWYGYQLIVQDPAEPRSDEELLARRRRQAYRWSKAEGLALFLLIDRFSPGWQEGVLDRPPQSPFMVLKEAIEQQRTKSR